MSRTRSRPSPVETDERFDVNAIDMKTDVSVSDMNVPERNGDPADDHATSRAYRMDARARSAAQTRERIADAMLDRFARTPYEQIRLDDVAADAGVTVQTVIRRFGGKAALMVAVAERELGRIAASRAAAVPRQEPGERPARVPAAAVLAALVDHYEQYGDLILKSYSEAPLIEGMPQLAARGREFHVEWCRSVFAAHLDPRLDEETRRVRLAQIVALCDATTWRILRHDGGLDPAEVERAIGELLAPILD